MFSCTIYKPKIKCEIMNGGNLCAKNFLADKGYDSQFGARPLHRAIQKYLEDPLAEEILNTFLSTPFEGGRHERRVAMLADIENEETSK